MSARRSPVERDARILADEALKTARHRQRHANSAYDVFECAIQLCERSTAWAVQRGDIPGARREARAAQLLNEAQTRMLDLRGRATARELALSGIVPGVRVRVVQPCAGPGSAPVGAELTLGDTTSKYMFGEDDHGRRQVIYAPWVELVPYGPIPDSRIVERVAAAVTA